MVPPHALQGPTSPGTALLESSHGRTGGENEGEGHAGGEGCLDPEDERGGEEESEEKSGVGFARGQVLQEDGGEERGWGSRWPGSRAIEFGDFQHNSCGIPVIFLWWDSRQCIAKGVLPILIFLSKHFRCSILFPLYKVCIVIE